MTLPLLRPVIAIILVIRFADAFRIFDVVYVLTGSGPAQLPPTCSRPSSTGRCSSMFDFAGGAAASILLVVITALASLLAVVVLRQRRRGAMSRRRREHNRFARLSASSAPSCVLARRLPSLRHPDPLDRLDLVQAAGRDLHHADHAPPAAADARELRGRVRAASAATSINSLIAAGGVTLLGLFLCVPAAFGFASIGYRVSGLLLSFIVGHPHLSADRAGAALLSPVPASLGLIDTPFGLIIAYIPIVLPLMIWILEGFFRDYPERDPRGGRIDGLGAIATLLRIVVPTSLPALGVATLFGFLVAWNEFVIALTLTRTPAGQTLPVGISTLITQFQTLWGQMMAVAAIYLLPVLFVTVVTQRGLVRGLMTGATKG